jgi:ABC-type multidrug transport system ATPase subunit
MWTGLTFLSSAKTSWLNISVILWALSGRTTLETYTLSSGLAERADAYAFLSRGGGPAGRERALELLEVVGLSHRKNSRLSELSGGEQHEWP